VQHFGDFSRRRSIRNQGRLALFLDAVAARNPCGNPQASSPVIAQVGKHADDGSVDSVAKVTG
jgi:hypothetical protein